MDQRAMYSGDSGGEAAASQLRDAHVVPSGATNRATRKTVIEVENLRKAYGGTIALDSISLDVTDGEIFGVVGPNGAGKTSAVECLEGLRRRDEGTVRVLGLDPQSQGAELRQRIGVQLQQAALPKRMKVWEALDLFASYYKRSAQWEPLVEEWGLQEKHDAHFSDLSGGQQQRLFIALALINEPEVIFLDELTTGLDPQARHATWDLVRAIRDRGKTVVLVTHFMEEAERLCDRVAIIDHGRIVALDTPAALVNGLPGEVEVRFLKPPGFEAEWLRPVPGVRNVVTRGEEVTIVGSGALLARVAATLAERGVVPADITSNHASLEDVFLSLTGRNIRN